MAAVRAHAPRPPPACRFSLDVPGDATRSPRPLPLSPVLIPSPGPLSFTHPNGFVAAARHHRSHRAPLAFPCCPAAPSRRPRPLSRVRQRRTACIAPCTLDFAASAPRSPATSRRRQPVPDRAVCFYVTAVSSATFSPFSFSLSSSVATARSSPGRAAAELVAGAIPATPRPRHPHGWMRTSVRIP